MISINIIDLTYSDAEAKAQVVKRVIADFPAHFAITTYLIDDYLKTEHNDPNLILINYEIEPQIIRELAIDLQKREQTCYFIFYNQNPRYIKENPTQSLIRMIETGHFHEDIRETLAYFMTLYDSETYFTFYEKRETKVVLLKDIQHIHLAHDTTLLYTTNAKHQVDDMAQVTMGPFIDANSFLIINKEHIIAYHAIVDVDGYEIILKDGYRLKINAGIRNKVIKKLRR